MQLERKGVRGRALAGVGVLSALLFGCDHATKMAATSSLAGSAPVPILGERVVLRYVENDDVAFSLAGKIGLGPSPGLLAALAAIALVVLGVVWWRTRERRPSTGLVDVGFAAVFAGALGNIVDRLTHGHVVDFIHVEHWPVFNVADIFVVGGIALVGFAKRRGLPRAAGEEAG